MESGAVRPVRGAKAVKGLLDEHGFKFSRSLGQNFLVDANIPEKIVRFSNVDKTCGVLEIGPGIGALTTALAHKAGFVTAVELDMRLLPLLREVLLEFTNVEIVHGDILKLDIAAIMNEKMPGLRHHVCANLPYNITTPALTALISAQKFETITVMVQREVAHRICAKPGSPDYGAFSVYADYHTVPEILFDVPPDCFLPRPNVYSSVVTLRPRVLRYLESSEEAVFFRVVRAAFGQRRKTLVNSLHAAFGNTMEKDRILATVCKCGFDSKVRGEALGMKEFMKLSAEIGKMIDDRREMIERDDG